MKKNFNELFSKMKPEAQERVKARSSELLKAMDLADLQIVAEEQRTCTPSGNATASDDSSSTTASK